jgi:hypothetical protein
MASSVMLWVKAHADMLNADMATDPVKTIPLLTNDVREVLICH